MTRVIRSRRAGLSRDQVRQQPLYARLLGLQYLAPSGFLCFVFLEGAVVLGILLALAELVSWWGVLVLPVTVAVMVKLNDVVAGLLARPAVPSTSPPAPEGQPMLRPAVAREDVSLGRATTVDLRGRVTGEQPPMGLGAVNGPSASRRWVDHQQWLRQSATKRYE